MSPKIIPLDLGMMTDVGRSREQNEDSLKTFNADKYDELGGRLFVVADGVGGASFGEIASRMAVEQIGELYYQQREQYPEQDTVDALRDVIELVNRKIYEEATARMAANFMATTITVAVLNKLRLTVAWVGDSRAYLLRPTPLTVEQLTQDHTRVEEQFRRNLISREEADRREDRNVLSRSLGGEFSVSVDFVQRDVQAGDVILLCTDGLTKHLEASEMPQIVFHETAMQAAQSLVNLANARSGSDNISVIVVQIGQNTQPQTVKAKGEAATVMSNEVSAPYIQIARPQIPPAEKQRSKEPQRAESVRGSGRIVVGVLVVILLLGIGTALAMSGILTPASPATATELPATASETATTSPSPIPSATENLAGTEAAVALQASQASFSEQQTAFASSLTETASPSTSDESDRELPWRVGQTVYIAEEGVWAHYSVSDTTAHSGAHFYALNDRVTIVDNPSYDNPYQSGGSYWLYVQPGGGWIPANAVSTSPTAVQQAPEVTAEGEGE